MIRLFLLTALLMFSTPALANSVATALAQTVYIQQGGATGSGFAIDNQTIITNSHVILDDSPVDVFLPNGAFLEGTIVGTDLLYDIVVIRIPKNDFVIPVTLGSSSELLPGETLTMAGSPYGMIGTVTQGIVSNTGARTHEYGPRILTTAPVNPGNSGGLVLNDEGELVGIVQAFVTGNDMGVIIPVDYARRSWEMILKKGTVTYFTIEPGQYAMVYREHGSINVPLGIQLLTSTGSFASWGLEPLDIIAAVNNKPIRNFIDFDLAWQTLMLGDTVSITVQRGNSTIMLVVYLE